MARTTGMRLEDLCEDNPVLHHQYALSQVVQRRGTHSRCQPTQLVYPDGSIAIGFPPVSLKQNSFSLPGADSSLQSRNGSESVSGGGPANPPSNGSQSEENADSLVVVYVSETPVSQMRSKYNLACGLFCFTIALQSCQILSLFLGGPLLSLVDVSFLSATKAPVQRFYYLVLLFSQPLAAAGLFLRSPLTFTIYGAVQMAGAVAGAAMLSVIDIDVLVIVLGLANRFASSEVSFLLMPHAFVAAPNG